MSAKEQPNTYFFLDRTDPSSELKRLDLLDAATTAGMGGVLPEQSVLPAFGHVLDVGCGTGGWLIALAQALPGARLLIGVDANHAFVEHARARAKEAGVDDRVEFHVADALRMLEFPDEFFDLVNHRFAWSWLRTWDWSELLKEYLRVSRPGGIVRMTEGDIWTSNSPALTRLIDLFATAMQQSGHTFREDANGVADDLSAILGRHGLQQVQVRAYDLRYSAGSAVGYPFFENIALAYQNIVPFLHKWTRVPDDYDQIYRQMLQEMQQPDFAVSWHVVTAWGYVLSSE